MKDTVHIIYTFLQFFLETERFLFLFLLYMMRFVAFLRRYENQYTRSRDFTHLDGARETKNMTKKGKNLGGIW